MFFKFIIFLIVFVLIVRWLGLSLTLFSNFRKAQRNRQNQPSPRKEGEVRITLSPQKDKKINSDEGEYVDYEDASGS